jgi:phosphohistidine phosphatase
MKLYFLRHGIAASREAWTGDDALRPLTEKGRKRLDQVAAFLAAQALHVDRILSSPLLRCAQTAELVARRLELAERLDIDGRLAPGFGPAALASLVRSHGDAGALMLVGHEPDFSDTIGDLIGGGRVVCRKGGVACVDVPDVTRREGELEWLLPPALLAS